LGTGNWHGGTVSENYDEKIAGFRSYRRYVVIIDAHHHLLLDEGYLEELVSECRKLNLDRVCLFGAGKRGRHIGIAGNDEVGAAMKKHPDLITGFACFDLGFDSPARILEFTTQGFRGIKFINPTKNYCDKEFYPVYELVEQARIPALFHLGIVSFDKSDKDYDVDNNRHRPIYLDTIARAFPDLKIIGAHLGNPWYEEATMAARWNPKLYFDLSGSTLKKKKPEFLGSLLWWTPASRYRDPEGRHAWEKIVFGSDVPACEIGDVLNDYRKTMDALNVPAEVREKVLGGTMAEILGISSNS